MRNGTQEELDAAIGNATLLPINTKFLATLAKGNPTGWPIGGEVWRTEVRPWDDAHSVFFKNDDDFWYADARDLAVLK